jgi:putative ATP-dependent endonuclease of OLD family
MIMDTINIMNYRSILNEVIKCEDLTALVGANGAGKSSFLQALNLFYNPSITIAPEDFYNGDTSKQVVIEVTYKGLSSEAKELFSLYLQGDRLTVARVFTCDETKVTSKYHGSTLQNPDFKSVRDALEIKDKAKTAKEAYEKLKLNPAYSNLPKWSTKDEMQEIMSEWETKNPERCVRRPDDGQFFGFKEVGQGYLGRFTRFLFIPAVRDVSIDTIEGRGSTITSLMDLVVRSVLASKEDITKLKKETQQKYNEIVDPSKLPELSKLADEMTKTLRNFVPDATVDLKWLPLSELEIPLPKADVRLIEDGYLSAVSRTGHGLQRAFILTMFQHLALAQTISPKADTTPSDSGTKTKLPNLVVAIEEPELYQHPSRQRHLAKIFQRLASGKTPGVAEKTQIIYSTHSPLFVEIDRINQVRLLRKLENDENKPKITKVVSTTLDDVAELVWKADGEPGAKYTAETMLARLQAIMTPWMNEGFFADVAVLVEGEDDRAAILGIAKAYGKELEGSGICVIPCNGKANLDRPYIIFTRFGIPVYMIWDGDYGKGETQGKCPKCSKPLDGKADPKENRRLLRLLSRPEVDWPDCVEDTFACFKYDMETTLKSGMGDEFFEKCLTECQMNLGIPKRKHATKNPNVIGTIVKKAHEQGLEAATLRQVLDKIFLLKRGGS